MYTNKKDSSGTRVFISYSRKDAVDALRIESILDRGGINVYIDTSDILPGEPWQERLSEMVTESDCIVICLTDNWLNSEICTWEARESVSSKKKIIPLLISGIPKGQIPEDIGRLNFLQLHSIKDEDAVADILIQAILIDINWAREHTRITMRARNWHDNGEDSHYCLLGNALLRAEAWMNDAKELASRDITDLQGKFIRASRRESERIAAHAAEQQRSKQQAEARLLIKISNDAANSYDFLGAAEAAYKAMPDPPRGQHRPYLPDAEHALYRAMGEIQLLSTKYYQTISDQLVVLANSHYLVISCQEGFLRVLDTSSLLECARIEIGGEFASKLAFHPDGKRIAAATPAGVVFVIDIENPSSKRVIHAHDRPVWTMAFSPDGTMLATGGVDQSVRVWDVNTSAELANFRGHGAPVGEITFSSDSRLVASASFRGDAANPDLFSVFCWCSRTSSEVSRFVGHTGYVTALSFDNNSETLVTAGFDETLRLWDVRSGFQVVNRKIKHAPVSMDRHPDGKTIVVVTSEGELILWSANDLSEIRGRNGNDYVSASFSKDGSLLLARTFGKGAHLMPSDLRGTVRHLRPQKEGHQISLMVNNNENVIIPAYDGTFTLWSRRPLLIAAAVNMHDDHVSAICWYRKGMDLFAGCDNGRLAHWDGVNGDQRIFSCLHHSRVIYIVLPNNDDSIYGVYENAGLAKWNIKTGLGSIVIPIDGQKLTKCIFCPATENFLLRSSDGVVWIIKINDKKIPTKMVLMRSIIDIQLTGTNETCMLLNDSGDLFTYNLKTNSLISNVHLYFNASAFWASQDCHRVLMKYLDRDALLLLNTESGMEIWSIDRNFPGELLCDFLDDGRRLIVCSIGSPSVEIYDFESGCCVGSFVASIDVISMAVNDNEPLVALGLADGSVECWTIFFSSEDLVACAYNLLKPTSA